MQGDDAWLADLAAVWARGDLFEPPDWVTHRARTAFRSLSRLRASLLYDSAAVGVRSGAVVGGTRPVPWQLLYRGGEIDIDLLVRPNQDGRTLNVRGQALSIGTTKVSAGVVEALPSARATGDGDAHDAVRSTLEPGGEFAFFNLERGRYDVFLRFGTHEIELNDVEF